MRGRPARTRSEARSGQRNALRAARRNARTRIPELSSAFRASSSARSALDRIRLTNEYRERAHEKSLVSKGKRFLRTFPSDRACPLLQGITRARKSPTKI